MEEEGREEERQQMDIDREQELAAQEEEGGEISLIPESVSTATSEEDEELSYGSRSSND